MRRFKRTPDIGEALSEQRHTGDHEAQQVKWSCSAISRDLAARVARYARRESCTRSTIVNLALQEFLDRRGA